MRWVFFVGLQLGQPEMHDIFNKKAVPIHDTPYRTEFAIRLKEARKQAGKTQQEAAEAVRLVCLPQRKRLSISRTNITNYETGYAIPPVDVFVQLCVLYGVKPNDILGF